MPVIRHSAELSSVTTALEELARRLEGLAASLPAEEREKAGVELYSVESTLVAAARRLRRLLA